MKDLIILGNGMAGMTAALYAKRANLDFKIVGKDEFDFGQIGNAILVENYPCSENLTGFDLAMKLHDQLLANDVKIEEHTITSVSCKSDKTFLIKYEDGTVDHTKTIIYSLGATYRQLQCKTDGDVLVHYCALCDGLLYKNKNVVVIGGGDSAFTQAEYLSKFCNHVQILMCDMNITANTLLQLKVAKNNKISIRYNTPINLIQKVQNDYLIYSCDSINGDKVFTSSGIFVAIGMKPNVTPLLDGKIRVLDNRNYIIANEDAQTTLPGFFAAGDVRTKQLRQSITAAADGANAVQSVINYLNLEKTKNEIK